MVTSGCNACTPLVTINQGTGAITYDAGYYSGSPTSNPHGPATGAAHVRRGGAFDSDPPDLHAAARASGETDLPATGFRCARDF